MGGRTRFTSSLSKRNGACGTAKLLVQISPSITHLVAHLLRREEGSADPVPCWPSVVKAGKRSPFRLKTGEPSRWGSPALVLLKNAVIAFSGIIFPSRVKNISQPMSMGQESTEPWESGSSLAGKQSLRLFLGFYVCLLFWLFFFF